MTDVSATREEMENVHVVYNQVCTSVRAIDDFRASLLGLLPLASGAGIFLLLGGVLGGGRARITSELLLPVGAFGFAVTLGLYLYEMRGIQNCSHLIATGTALEERLGVEGRFRTHPPAPGGFVNEIWAAHIIYAAVLAGWTFVMSILPNPDSRQPAVELASALSVSVFLVVILVATQVPLLPRPRGEPPFRHGTDAGDLPKAAPTSEPR